MNVHLHIHEGASPEAVKAAVEAIHEKNTTEADPGAQGNDAEQDAQVIRQAYLDSQEKAKPLLEYLADNASREIPYPEISERLGFTTSRSLPGLLGAFSRRADHRYGGVQPFERRNTSGGWRLYMSRENAELINELRD
ncbi:MAG: hypothetical protein WA862_04070 [Solirubrobacterales bacterium]